MLLSIGKDLTPEQRVPKAVTAIMPRAHAIAGVMMIGKRFIEHDAAKVPTACTNGLDEWYGYDYVDSLTDAELRCLVLHEVYHKMFRHPITYLHLNTVCHRTANIACDYVINQLIMDEFGHIKDAAGNPWIVMPEGGCLDAQYKGMEVSQVFWLIYKECETEEEGGASEQGDGHATGFDDIDFEGASELSDQDKADLTRDVDEAIRQGVLIAGKTGSGGLLSAKELLAAKVDWREAMRDFAQDTCVGDEYTSYRRPNKRWLQYDMYMPSGVTDTVGELVLAADTSGSVLSVAGRWLAEAKALCDTIQPERLRLLYWDTEVCREEVYERDDLANLLTATKPSGGGGTDVNCVTRYIQDNEINAQACIVLTDGHLWGGWGEWTVPVLWCVLDNKDAQPDVGKVLHIKSGDV